MSDYHDRAATVSIIDGHTDVLLDLLHPNRSPGRDFFRESDTSHVDLPRLKKGGIGAAFCACYLPDDWNTAERSWRETLGMVDLLHRLVDQSDGHMQVVRDAGELNACLHQGIFGAILHFEGADAIDPDFVLLRIGYALGLRSLGLTWSRPNRYAEGVGDQDTGQGLTEDGKNLVRTCNELGILIDVSHLNDVGFWDVLELSDRPIVASHSNVRAISPHPRNLTDDQISGLAAKGGLLGLNFAVRFLWPDASDRKDVPLDLMADHVLHVIDLVGPDFIAIGSDFDGTWVPDVIRDAAGSQALLFHLRDRGVDEETISKIAHENWLRVLAAVW